MNMNQHKSYSGNADHSLLIIRQILVEMQNENYKYIP